MPAFFLQDLQDLQELFRSNMNTTCHTFSALLTCRPFELPLTAGPTPGNYLIPGHITTPDSNPDNDPDTTPVVLFATCVNPFGVGPATCPAGLTFVGPAGKPINSTLTFEAQCCSVSALQCCSSHTCKFVPICVTASTLGLCVGTARRWRAYRAACC